MGTPEDKQHGLVRELRATRCRCGRRKGRGKTFCGPCFYSLSKAQQRALYRFVGNGYEEAYADAVATLKAKEGNQ